LTQNGGFLENLNKVVILSILLRNLRWRKPGFVDGSRIRPQLQERLDDLDVLIFRGIVKRRVAIPPANARINAPFQNQQAHDFDMAVQRGKMESAGSSIVRCASGCAHVQQLPNRLDVASLSVLVQVSSP
jgi:hypothetical protein